MISILLLFSVSCVFAGDNETVSEMVGSPIELDEITSQEDTDQLQVSDDSILSANNNVINIVDVRDSYNENSKTWDEDGFALKGATVKVFDSNHKLISTHKTDSKGNVAIKNLGSNKYYLEVSYSTYETQKLDVIDFTKNSGTVTIKDIMFTPDILLLVDYNSHNEKVDVLIYHDGVAQNELRIYENEYK